MANEFKRMVQEKLEADMRKQAERSQRMAATSYGRQTTCMVNNPYTPTQQKKASPPPRPSPLSRSEIEVERLTEENQKLKNQYSDLLKKANKLVEAYRELKTENEALVLKNQTLTLKKMKKEAVTKSFADVGKGVQKGIDKIILWFNT